MARSFASDTGIRVTLNVEDIAGIDTRTETELYRIAREALTNVRLHSGAGRVQICLESHGNGLVMAVTDDGVGFRRSDIRDGAHGLIGMRERARLIGGTLRVGIAGGTFGAASKTRPGTRVLVRARIANE